VRKRARKEERRDLRIAGKAPADRERRQRWEVANFRICSSPLFQNFQNFSLDSTSLLGIGDLNDPRRGTRGTVQQRVTVNR